MVRFIWIIVCLSHSAVAIPRPNIIFILADDLGWNDVGFHGSDEISTPNIDALAYNGIILNNHYSENLCTPSRAALLTGKYPIHTGTQHNVILEPEPWGLPLEFKLMPQHLKHLGYATHAIGKWHLGYYRKVYTPQYRGFDSHYGFWNGYQDYYNHTVQASDLEGFDMRRGLLIDKDSVGNYSTDLFTDEAISLIMNHDTDRPLFLYLSHLATHAGNYENPLQAPEEVIQQFEHIKDERRRTYAAMLWKLDESVGRVLEALQTAAMLDNTIIAFVSDNGGGTQGLHANTGSNYPLKGEKQTPWEGGLRSVACLWSASMANRSRVATQLMHITDWLPTLYAAAGGDIKDLGAIDGHDMWSVLSENEPSPRNVILHNIDDITRYAAVRVGPIKYVNGTTILGFLDHWVGEDTKTKGRVYNTSSVLNSTTSRVLADYSQPTLQEMMSLRRDATVHCKPPTKKYPACVPLKQPCVFDIEMDPCEKMNLYRELGKEKIRSLEKIIGEFRRTARKPENKKTDLTANPRRYNNVWTNWGDYKNSMIRTK